ncbi:MAG: NAD(P)-dependent oxidoreductase [Rhodospirillaceae bacterium]|nr:NAD(P)-dependent oxidoreductase [Rhodospirillaceae bacterium]
MKVAVTGAGGFIGRNVVAELKTRGIFPHAVLRPSSKVPPHLSDCEIVRIDIASSTENSFDLMGRPDVLIHLAWGGLPNYKSEHHMDEELPAQYSFLSGLIESGLGNLVVTGTCFEYGMQGGALKPDMETFPTNPYGQAKDELRKRLQTIQQTKPFLLTWARLFYLFGDGQSDNSLWMQLKKAVERGDKTFNMSGGEQIRDFLPISEAARQIVSVALSPTDLGVINICSGKPISVLSLVEQWIAENGWSISLNTGHYPYPDYEPMEFWGINH